MRWWQWFVLPLPNTATSLLASILQCSYHHFCSISKKKEPGLGQGILSKKSKSGTSAPLQLSQILKQSQASRDMLPDGLSRVPLKLMDPVFRRLAVKYWNSQNYVKHLLPGNDDAAFTNSWKNTSLNICNTMHLYSNMEVTPGLLSTLITCNTILILPSMQRNPSLNLIKWKGLYTHLTNKLFLMMQHQGADTRPQFGRNLRNKLCWLLHICQQGWASVL